MKKWIWGLGGGSAVALIGVIGYLTYKKIHISKTTPSTSILMIGKSEMGARSKEIEKTKPKTDIADVLSQCLIESMPIYLNIAQRAKQLQNKGDEQKNRDELRKQCKFVWGNIVEEAIQQLEKGICDKTGWGIEEYYEEVMQRQKYGDS